MQSRDLFKIEIPCKQGSLSAFSTYDIQNQDIHCLGEPLIIHAGMGKRPEVFTDIMTEAAAEGYVPIAFDTRWYEHHEEIQYRNSEGLSWKEQILRRWLHQKKSFDTPLIPNPDNSYSLRRILALEHGLEYLGIKDRTLLGHSDGGRISTLVALRNPQMTTKLILLNPAGAGNSWHGYKRLIRSNKDEIAALASGEIRPKSTLKGGLISTLYTLKHPYRTRQEKRVIQATNLWEYIDQLQGKDIPISVLAAKNDRLISFEDIESAANERPWIKFTPTDGRHTNVLYNDKVKKRVLSELLSA